MRQTIIGAFCLTMLQLSNHAQAARETRAVDARGGQARPLVSSASRMPVGPIRLIPPASLAASADALGVEAFIAKGHLARTFFRLNSQKYADAPTELSERVQGIAATVKASLDALELPESLRHNIDTRVDAIIDGRELHVKVFPSIVKSHEDYVLGHHFLIGNRSTLYFAADLLASLEEQDRADGGQRVEEYLAHEIIEPAFATREGNASHHRNAIALQQSIFPANYSENATSSSDGQNGLLGRSLRGFIDSLAFVGEGQHHYFDGSFDLAKRAFDGISVENAGSETPNALKRWGDKALADGNSAVARDIYQRALDIVMVQRRKLLTKRARRDPNSPLGLLETELRLTLMRTNLIASRESRNGMAATYRASARALITQQGHSWFLHQDLAAIPEARLTLARLLERENKFSEAIRLLSQGSAGFGCLMDSLTENGEARLLMAKLLLRLNERKLAFGVIMVGGEGEIVHGAVEGLPGAAKIIRRLLDPRKAAVKSKT